MDTTSVAHNATPAFGTVAVLGAGIAGLLAARVLADHVREVVLVERDSVRELGTAPRKGVPQGLHPHNLLASGRQVLESLFPGLSAELHAAAAPQGGGAFFSAGGYLEAPADGGSLYASRALLEAAVRQRVLALSQVRLIDGTHAELPAPEGGRVAQVRLRRLDGGTSTLLPVDLVVDALGRGSRTTAWLAASGYPAPAVERVDVGMRYATREFRRTPQGQALLGGRSFFVVSPAPGAPRACGILAQEDDRWIVTLIGYFGEQPPLDAAGFLAYARQLPTHEPEALIANTEPLGEIRGFAFAANVRVRHDRAARRPSGLLVTGDALAAFSPAYGQGMSVAALQAQALQRVLHEHIQAGHARHDLEARWYDAAIAATELPWALAAGGDRQLSPGGPHGTLAQRLRSRWVRRVICAGHRDARVATAFVRVARLLAPPSSLLHPAIVWRVLRA
jgi:2-polyprenyl-6-methoxyphenol hydroxylase-like FAD-dependent oxidoreductase